MRRVTAFITGGLFLAGSAALLLFGPGGCSWFVPAQSSMDILREAARRARLQDPDAIVFAAEGLYGGAFAGGSQTLAYTFLATDPDNATTTWQLEYDRTAWTLTEHESPFVGVAYHDLTQVAMSFEDARALLLAAGHEDSFEAWSLHQLLFNAPNPVFTFTYAARTVIIDTMTQTVTVVTHEGPPSEPLLGSPGDDSVSIQMIQAAGEEIRKHNTNAYIIWAGGRDGAGGSLDAPGDTNTWDFYAVDNGADLKSYTLGYDGQWSVAELAWPPMGIEFRDISQITMDVVEAWQVAVDAGYPGPFNWWVVFKPLNPNVPNAVIVFGQPSGLRIVVDTVTGEVTTE